MDEKNKQTLTFDDILHQLTKPSVVQGQGDSVEKKVVPLPPSPLQLPVQLKNFGGVSLPSLGSPLKPPVGAETSSRSEPPPQQTTISLTVRTMAQDIQKLRQGQKPASVEVSRPTRPSEQPRSSVVMPVPRKATPETPRDIPAAPSQYRPALPPIPHRSPLSPPKQSTDSPPIPLLSKLPEQKSPFSIPIAKEKPSAEYTQEHYHREEVVGKIDDVLPEYLGAKIPKKIIEPVQEKLQYGVIARIVGSGMTAGITITVIIAIIGFILLRIFVFNDSGFNMSVSPTPIPTQSVQTPEPNELESIFINVMSIDFSLPANQVETAPNLKALMKETEIKQNEFKKIKFISSSSQPAVLNFTDLLDRLSIRYPASLRDAIKENNMAFMYGQEEELMGADPLPDPGLANKKIVLIVEINNTVKATEVLRGWESTMPNDLKNVFNIEPGKGATSGFLNNSHRGVPIRYKNFPLPDRSIDYSIVHALSGRDYLVIANSRESMYSPAEKITGL